MCTLFITIDVAFLFIYLLIKTITKGSKVVTGCYKIKPKSLMHRHFATVCSRIARFSPK